MTRFSITGSVLIDSNILVIAHTANHPYVARAQALITDLVDGRQLGVVAHQNLLEFYATITNPKFTSALAGEKANGLIATYLRSQLRVITPTSETINLLISWQKMSVKPKTGQQIYDRYLAATALTHGVTTILTENTKNFRDIPGIQAINPFT